MALALQLLMLFIVTSGFAVPSAALLNVTYVAVAAQGYICDTNSGTYVSSTFRAELYDASSVSSIASLDADVFATVNAGLYNGDVGFPGLDAFIPGVFGFQHTANARVIDDSTVQIQSLDQSSTWEVRIIPETRSTQGVTLTDLKGTTVVVSNPVPVPSQSCEAFDIGFRRIAIELVYLQQD